jgi:hypothetical protein
MDSNTSTSLFAAGGGCKAERWPQRVSHRSDDGF